MWYDKDSWDKQIKKKYNTDCQSVRTTTGVQPKNKVQLKSKTEGQDSPSVFAIHYNFLMINTKEGGIIEIL